ncbi:MAG: hypothetical protein HYV65_01535 [Candidatus Spechtbacteria bacterium]|nr:hypothetical protein [Candidatus Spechtbacteria bacterium]
MAKKLIRYLFWVLFGVLAVFIFISGYLFLGIAKPAEKITWGVTFGQSQAKDLGLDWKETYMALLDDMRVRNFRLPVYWDELEPQKDEYDFAPWDFQLQELKKRDGKAILVIGFKLPRWPECRFPSWYQGLSEEEKSARLFKMLRVVVMHYKNDPTIWAWQVENESLLRFGVCPSRDKELLDDELYLVRELDPSRPIIVSDTGENSFWIEAGQRANIIGSTLYRVIHNPTLGYVHYPYPPVMYYRKMLWARWLFPLDDVIFSEVQAEPWVVQPPISRYSLQDQYKTMSPDMLADNIAYVRQTGFDTAYLWGAEWWYWTKVKGGDDKVWNEMQAVFQDK